MRKGQRQPGSTLGVRHNQNRPRSLCVSPGVGNSLQGTQAWDVRGVKAKIDTSPGSGVSYRDRAPSGKRLSFLSVRPLVTKERCRYPATCPCDVILGGGIWVADGA